MAKVNCVEDLVVWKKSRELVKIIFGITSTRLLDKEFFLKDQIKRSSISIMSNIAEGFGRGGNKEFIHFLYIAKGSLTELKSQLYIAMDVSLLTEEETKTSFGLIKEIDLMVTSLSRHLKTSDIKGMKYKD